MKTYINTVLSILKQILLIFFFVSISGLFSFAQNQHLEFVNLFKSGTDSVSCYRIPSLATAPNGDLIAAIDERVPSCGDLKWNNDINIVIRRSKDNGKNWLKKEVIIDYPFGESASDPSMIVDRITGEVFLFFNYMDLKNKKDQYRLRYIKSTNNGESWEEPVDITSQITKPDWEKDFMFITSGKGIQTKKGKLLHTLVNLQNNLHLFASDDHGESWYLIHSPIQPADESKIVELSNGNWMVNSRVRDLGCRYIHLSEDQGKTWKSQPNSNLPDPACNASIIRYQSDQFKIDPLIFCNANHTKNRLNLTVRISFDNGKSWSKGRTIYSGGSAYSSMAILQNGRIGVFFEKDDYIDHVFTTFSLDWLINDELKK